MNTGQFVGMNYCTKCGVWFQPSTKCNCFMQQYVPQYVPVYPQPYYPFGYPNMWWYNGISNVQLTVDHATGPDYSGFWVSGNVTAEAPKFTGLATTVVGPAGINS